MIVTAGPDRCWIVNGWYPQLATGLLCDLYIYIVMMALLVDGERRRFVDVMVARLGVGVQATGLVLLDVILCTSSIDRLSNVNDNGVMTRI